MNENEEPSVDIPSDRTTTDEIRSSNRIQLERWKSQCPDFAAWLSSLSRFGSNPIDAMVLSQPETTRYRAILFTEGHRYVVDARPDDPGYLGCIASARKPRAGEDWTRGNDLADGPYCIETWQRIIADIVSSEMVRLGK